MSVYKTFETEDDAESQKRIMFTGDGQLPVKPPKNIFSMLGLIIAIGALIVCGTIVTIRHVSESSSNSGPDTPPDVMSDDMTTDSVTRPNFVFILVDDMGFDTLGLRKGSNQDTSAAATFIRSLANDGVFMTKYYAQEICTPSRAALMTGRYPITIGQQYDELQPDVEWGLNVSEVLLPEVLRDYGNYKNYMIGKWNLGHFTPQLLPTARGFHEYMGFLSGQNYYWSKLMPNMPDYTDMLISNTDCYQPYNDSDLNKYSTFLYTDKAVNLIQSHDFDSNPMFLYFAIQATHDPFDDYNGAYSTGLPSEYFTTDVYSHLTSITGINREQYALTLKLLDDAVESVYNAVDAAGQLNNTYFILASDNGGCFQAGGRNGDLRGTKGSLFEGGTRVEAFIYSELIPPSARGKIYDELMHVSDWFPTMLALANLTYTPEVGHELDGLDHAASIFRDADGPRDYLLYNIYTNVEETEITYSDSAVAIRNDRYKLMHGYTDNQASSYYSFSHPLADDYNLESYSCPQTWALEGTFGYFLFDLDEDPNETINLYNISHLADVQAELYEKLYYYLGKVKEDVATSDASPDAEPAFISANSYIVPWSLLDSSEINDPQSLETRTYPSYCDVTYGLLLPSTGAADRR